MQHLATRDAITSVAPLSDNSGEKLAIFELSTGTVPHRPTESAVSYQSESADAVIDTRQSYMYLIVLRKKLTLDYFPSTTRCPPGGVDLLPSHVKRLGRLASSTIERTTTRTHSWPPSTSTSHSRRTATEIRSRRNPGWS